MVKFVRGDRIGKQGKIAVGCSAAVFDSSHERLLLVRRADNAQWTVPGGYMDAGESLTEACAREVWEETGLRVRVKRLISAYTNPHALLEYPDGNRWQLVVLHFEAEQVGGDLRVSDETTAVKFFSRSEIKNLEMAPENRLRIEDSFAIQSETIVRDIF